MLKFKGQKRQEPPKQDYWKWDNLKKKIFGTLLNLF